MCFALGAHTTEQFKHLAPGEAGPLAGLAVLPGLRALRPRLAQIAGGLDPLDLQRAFASAMLAADPVTSSVYYVDDHFVPYTGAKPVGKGWNNKRGRAEKGRADTHVTAHDGRAVCFVTGEPSGLSVTLPMALAELTGTARPAPAMSRVRPGRRIPAVFAHCRGQGVHWVSYRRAPLAVPAMLPVHTPSPGRQHQADHLGRGKRADQGLRRSPPDHVVRARQGGPAGADGDLEACPAEMLAWLKSRWREENFLKYAAVNYGIDKICDYFAEHRRPTSRSRTNPARKPAYAAVRGRGEGAGRRRAGPGSDCWRTRPSACRQEHPHPGRCRRRSLAPGTNWQPPSRPASRYPAKAAANAINPGAEIAVLRAGRRGLQMVLRLLAHNAEHWLSGHLNAYLRDDDEYRAITRETIIRGLAGTITLTPAAITVRSSGPPHPRIPRALALLIAEINHAARHARRPPAHHLPARPATRDLTPGAQPLPEIWGRVSSGASA